MVGASQDIRRNRPSSMILLDRLTPETLGKLIALYEHSVLTQGAISKNQKTFKYLLVREILFIDKTL
jgi:glucose-6-phosphate isomerase